MSEQWPSEASASKYLISTLATLAADARDQIAWLDRYRLEPDELALDDENAKAAILVLAEAGRIDPVMQSRLSRIEATLDAMSGKEQALRWTYEALMIDAGWLTVRELARKALTEFAGTWKQPLPELGVKGGAGLNPLG